MRGVFITGTDTGVGKTVITAGLLQQLRSEGMDLGAVKPVQSGHRAGDPEGDTRRLIDLGGLEEGPGSVNAYALAAPLAPLVAARLEGVTIDPARVLEFVRACAARHDAVLVEGAGGWMVPLAQGWMVADLAAALGLAVLIVARPGLGTVNHTVLTVKAVRDAGLEVAGVILNGPQVLTDESRRSNAGLIEEFGGVRVLGTTPWLDVAPTPDRLRGMINDHIDLGPLRRHLVPAVEWVPARGEGTKS